MSGQPPSRMGAAQRPWAFTASAYGDVIPDDDDYLSAVAWADRRWLHLEGRYNYEDLKTGSVCAGANFSVGHDAWLDVTPMLGGVFGQTSGIAPAYRVAAGYGIVDAYSEDEYLVAGDSTDNFFYAWSELGVTPLAWLRIGIAGQRTRVYQTELEIQRGFLVGLSHGPTSLSTYVFNLGWDSPTVVFSAAVEFSERRGGGRQRRTATPTTSPRPGRRARGVRRDRRPVEARVLNGLTAQ